MTTRVLGLGIVAIGLVSIGANPPVASAKRFIAETPAAVQLMESPIWISTAALATINTPNQAGYNVEITNKTAADSDVVLHLKNQAVTVKAKAKVTTKAYITETDPTLAYDCQLVGRTVSFSLTGGSGVDTKAHNFEWIGNQVWKASAGAGLLPGEPATIPDGPKQLWAETPATMTAPWVCGTKPRITFKLDNTTAKTLTGIKLRMIDADGTVLAEDAVSTMAPGLARTVSMTAGSAPKGIQALTSNAVMVHIIDSKNELAANQITSGAWISYEWTGGPVSLKAIP